MNVCMGGPMENSLHGPNLDSDVHCSDCHQLVVCSPRLLAYLTAVVLCKSVLSGSSYESGPFVVFF